ncbi:MAG TPA: ElyC/SanA/YdcF family protein [Anaerolineae bacterium]|nr:ElyC/SanA/YdcF family protein [Anaerolineae bacterium]
MITIKTKVARLAYRFLITGLGLSLSVALFPWLLRAWVHWQVEPHIYIPGDEVPAADVALVLGAGLQRNGRPTAVLHDRVVTAVELYQQGRVKKLLMSGDNRFVYHNEPGAMRDLAVELGVPPEDIVLDYAGQRTYDSCYRAREIFAVERVIIVTQRFHLNRALYLCQSLGLQAVGTAADRRPYRGERWWQLRELAALTNAWLDIHLLRPVPVLGERLPIVVARQ